MTTHNILFTNNYSSLNRGSAAMAISTSISIKKYLPSIKLTNLSLNPDIDSRIYDNYGIQCIERKLSLFEPFYFGLFILWCFFYRSFKVNIKFLLQKYFKEYSNTDLIIDIVGDSFTDVKMWNFFHYCYGVTIGILAKKPIIIYPQSIGPFKSTFGKIIAIWILNKTRFIFVREEITNKYLLKLKITTPIMPTPDIAFLLPVVSQGRINNIMAKENIKIDSNLIIGISANELMNILLGKHEHSNQIKILANVINYLVKYYNSYVILIPHVFAQNNDDRKINNLIYSCINKEIRPYVKLIENEYSPEELKGIISQCDIFIGARMHANIAALSTGVPTLALAYSHKTHGIMQMLGQGDYICDLENLSYEEIILKFQSLWNNKEKVKEQLRIRNKVLRTNALNCGAIVKEILLNSK